MWLVGWEKSGMSVVGLTGDGMEEESVREMLVACVDGGCNVARGK